MKKLQVLLLVALSSTLLFGCGKEKEVVEPVVEQVIDDVVEPEVEEEPEEEPEEVDEDVPPEPGMVRSRITNEWIKEEINDTRPITVMIPNTKTAA